VGDYDTGKTDPHDPMGLRASRPANPAQRPAPHERRFDAGLKVPFEIVDLEALPGTPCPCGTSRRGFMRPDNTVASMHRVDISMDAKAHYHKHLTELYYVLECEGECSIELDGELHPVRPGMAVMIRPGTRHRAVGKMKILNVVVPPFDRNDEWL
jgi:mannose-6-phosphate isomerase-like protein (cupin superfamily)